MKYALILLMLIGGCAMPVKKHGYRVYKHTAYSFKYDGVFMSDKAMAGMMGKQLGKDE